MAISTEFLRNKIVLIGNLSPDRPNLSHMHHRNLAQSPKLLHQITVRRSCDRYPTTHAGRVPILFVHVTYCRTRDTLVGPGFRGGYSFDVVWCLRVCWHTKMPLGSGRRARFCVRSRQPQGRRRYRSRSKKGAGTGSSSNWAQLTHRSNWRP